MGVQGPYVTSRIHADAVRNLEHAFTPRPNEISPWIENDDWISICRSVKNVDVSALVGGHSRDSLEDQGRVRRNMDSLEGELGHGLKECAESI